MPTKAYVGVEGTSYPARPEMSNGELQAPNDQDEYHQQRPKPHTDQNHGGARMAEVSTETEASRRRAKMLHQDLLDRSHCL